MGKPSGFLEFERADKFERLIDERITDFKEFEISWPSAMLAQQGARCMDCGIPTCHSGCPLGNLIPDWNDLIMKGNFGQAIEELHRTNNFPEITGRICPAPCEDSCVLGINEPAVTIKSIEKAIADTAFRENWVRPSPPRQKSWKRVAVVGSGPTGLAGAQQLARLGHQVTVFEKADRPGGLLTYGIPDFKLEKNIVMQRVSQLQDEGVMFRLNINVGEDLSAHELTSSFDAVLLAGGAEQPRLLGEEVEGRNLKGIYPAMEYLTQQNRRNFAEIVPEQEGILATGKRVVILGGGDTGSDCLGTSHRQGATSVSQFEIMPRPVPLKVSSSHKEGGTRRFCVLTKGFSGDDGQVRELHGVEIEWVATEPGGRMSMREIPGTEFTEPVDLVLLAMGFLGPRKSRLLEELTLKMNERGAVWRDESYQSSHPAVFVAGDMTRGASLVVWAIWEGREAARNIHQYLSGHATA